MESKTTILKMIDHATTPYYFGHFLFERKGENSFAVIDGQQRLTTIIICLATMFKQDDEKFSDIKKKMIGEKFDYHFETVAYDDENFKSYVFEDVLDFLPDTISQKRIKESYDRFIEYFKDKSQEELDKILDAIKDASCSTYIVDSEAEAVQMFIFENNRGKNPSDLEILKANMMFGIHLQNIPEHKKSVVNQYLSKKFKSIYHSISQIEMAINEDNVLTYALQVYENNLKIDRKRMLNKVDKLIRENAVKFATEFTEYLEQSFSSLVRFFGQDRKEIWEFEELISLKDIGLAIPFILKAYKYNISSDDKARLAKSMRDILLRKRLIRRQADLNIRLGDVFEEFSEKYIEVQPIVERIEWLKNVDNGQWRSAYWNNEKLTESLESVNHQTAKYLLWLYEKHLSETKTTGYNFKHGYDELMINGADLEHIAPQTSGAEGYPEDDQDFRENYLNSLGNYLLLSASHNRSIGNISFEEKRQTYQISPLYQQREVVEMTDLERKWTKELIVQRNQTIIDFIMKEI